MCTIHVEGNKSDVGNALISRWVVTEYRSILSGEVPNISLFIRDSLIDQITPSKSRADFLVSKVIPGSHPETLTSCLDLCTQG